MDRYIYFLPRKSKGPGFGCSFRSGVPYSNIGPDCTLEAITVIYSTARGSDFEFSCDNAVVVGTNDSKNRDGFFFNVCYMPRFIRRDDI